MKQKRNHPITRLRPARLTRARWAELRGKVTALMVGTSWLVHDRMSGGRISTKQLRELQRLARDLDQYVAEVGPQLL